MSTEIDSLEIQVEAEARNANRALSSMEKHLDKIADSLMKVSALTNGVGGIGNFDFAGLKNFKTEMDSLFQTQKKMQKVSSPRINRSDLKYTAKSLDEIYDKFKKVGTGLDVSKMGLPELRSGLRKAESEVERLNQRLEKKISIEGTSKLGKSYESLVYDIQLATNKIKIFNKELSKVNNKKIEEIDSAIKRGKNIDSEEQIVPIGQLEKAEKAIYELGEQAKEAKKEIQFNDSAKSIEYANKKANEFKKTLNDIQSQPSKKSNAFSDLSNGILKAFKMDENGKLSNIGSLKNVFGDFFKSTSDSMLNGFKLEENGSIRALNSVKKTISMIKQYGIDDTAINSSKMIDWNSVFGMQELDQNIEKMQQELFRTRNILNGHLISGDIDSVSDDIADIKAIESELKNLQKIRKLIYSDVEKSLFPDADKSSKSLKNASKEGTGLYKVLKSIKSASKKINSAKSDIDSFRKSITNCKKAVSSILHPLRTLTGLFSESGKSANNGMSWGRMIGSSVLFSFVFQGISAIQNAIKEGSNNLVQYSQTYNNSISSIVTSLSYLKNAWAAAFSPIMNVVAPYLSAFIDMVASALNSVGQFMAALTGKGFAVQAKKVWTDYGASLSDVGTGGSDAAKGLNDAAKAAKDLESYTLGIDELNVIQPNTSSGSGSGGSGGGTGGSGGSGTGEISPSDMFETVEVSNSISKLADMVKEAWKNADFTEIGKLFGDKINKALESINWSKIKKTSYKIGTSVATFLNGTFKSKGLYRNIGVTVGEGLNTAIYLAKGFVDNFNFEDFGKSIADSINGFFETVEWDTAAETISEGIIGALKSLESFLDETDFEEIADSIVEFISHTKFGDVVSQGISTIISGAVAQTDFFTGIGKSIAKRIVEGITGKELSGDLEKKFNTAIKPVEEIWKTLFSNLNPVTNAVRIFNLVKDTIQTKGDNIKKYFSDLWNSIKVLFSPVADFFREKFKSAYQNVQNVWKFASSWFKENVWIKIKNVFSSVKDYFKSAFKTAYNAVTDVWDDLSSYFKGIANKAIKPIGSLVNGIIKGVNYVSDLLGVGKVLKSWPVPQFANGTDGVSRDTIGVVNDQKGSTYRELVQFPNGKAIIPEGRNVMMTLPKGTKVMPAGQTKDLMKSYPHFAGGIGDFFSSAWTKAKKIAGTVWDYMQNPEKLLQIAINKFTDISGMVKPWSTIAGGIINKIFSGATDYIKKLFDKAIPSVNYTPSAGVEQWRQLAAKALQMTGQYTAANLNLLLYQMKTESGGNPNAINNWDINAKNGTPSKGLMQVIDPTFKAYALDGYDKNIWDPLSNMLAAIRYTLSRYGSLANGWKGHGYATGGFPQTGEMFIANERGPELIGRMGNRNVVANNNQIVEGVAQGVETSFNSGVSLLLNKLDQVIEYQERLLKKDTSVNMDGKRVDKQIAKSRSNRGYSFSGA